MRLSTHRRCQIVSNLLSINIVLVILFQLSTVNCGQRLNAETIEDNEFAEFEEFDEDESPVVKKPPIGPTVAPSVEKDLPPTKARPVEDDDAADAVVEEDDDDVFKDSEEFENFESQDTKETASRGVPKKGEQLEITKVPLHLQSNWSSYYLEFLMISALVVYFVNFFIGRSRNQNIANLWLDVHKELLAKNFALVGDDGKKEPVEAEEPTLIKDADNVFFLWCSGRVGVINALIELRFFKRHDLVSVVGKMFTVSSDRVWLSCVLDSDGMDNFVFFLANKKTSLPLAKDLYDVSNFCPERKSPEKFGLRNGFFLFNEIGEAATIILDTMTVNLLNKNVDLIDFIHVTDQYSGIKTTEENALQKPTDIKKALFVAYRYPSKAYMDEESIENMKPMMQLFFYLLDKLRRIRLSKEGKSRSDKNRQRVGAEFLKATHAQRQEAAQVKREERRRAEKERILAEDNPEKQRKWEEREHRKELKKKAPKMKQLKVKAM